MTVLVVAEKPSVARDIASVLGARTRNDGFFTGNGWTVTWAIGHLVALAEPHEMNPDWKRWRLADLPLLPKKWPLVVTDGTRAQYAVVKKLMRAKDVRGIVCATDAGREGELIFRYIYEAAGATKPVKRLWISSLTADAIRDGFRALRDSAAFDRLGDSARARSRADWLVGMNLSRLYSVLNDANLSVGRVQTPTLAMIVERELEIRAFVPEDYLEIVATFGPVQGPADTAAAAAAGKYDGTYLRPNIKEPDTKRLPADGVEAARIIERAKRGEARIASVDRQTRRHQPPQLYDLTELQRHANRLYGFTAQRTLQLAQTLYEQRKLLSYPRTDSRHVSTSVENTFANIVSAISPLYDPALIAPGTGTRQLSTRFVDDARVSDHHAILPTQTRAPDDLPSDERRVYDLVCRRFLQAWHGDHVFAVTTVITTITTSTSEDPLVDRYSSSGTSIEVEGWKVLDVKFAPRGGGGAKTPAEPTLPGGLAKGMLRSVLDAKALPKKTRPPPRLTDGTLLTAMETAGRTLNEKTVTEETDTTIKEMTDAMRERGLGTPATRASILETLLRREYIVRDGKMLTATEKGIALIAVVHAHVKSPAMTGEWEAKLAKIEQGNEQLTTFMQAIETYVKDVVATVAATGASNPTTPYRLGIPNPPPSAPPPSSPPPPPSIEAGPLFASSSRTARAGAGDNSSTSRERAHELEASPRSSLGDRAGREATAGPLFDSSSRPARDVAGRPSAANFVSSSPPGRDAWKGGNDSSSSEQPHELEAPPRSLSDRSRSLDPAGPLFASLPGDDRKSRSDSSPASETLRELAERPPLSLGDRTDRAIATEKESLVESSSRSARDARKSRSDSPTDPARCSLGGDHSHSNAPQAGPLVPSSSPGAPPLSQPRPVRSRDLHVLLRDVFGMRAFRPYQEQVCVAATAGRDVLLVMPTGAGKSLCYQLPGIARAGTTLVISPLIALMEDQVAGLRKIGLIAERIHSGRNRLESREVCRAYLDGALDFLFIAPERLRVPGFPEMLARRKPSLIAIDEAHCISQWGHDFRPDYRMLGERLPLLRPTPVIALTATATPTVQNDIAKELRLDTPMRSIHGFRRTNIGVEVVERNPSERTDIVKRLLADARRKPAIVYAPTRSEAERLAKELTSAASRASAYHAGMTPNARDSVQAAFLSGKLDTIIATTAFGMGIDKPDVRTVIHTALPASIEGYYQEIGRAGRDGKPSRAVLLHSFVDTKTHDFFLERDYPASDHLAKIEKAIVKRGDAPDTASSADAIQKRAKVPAAIFDKALEKLWIHGGATIQADAAIRRGPNFGQWQLGYDKQRAHKQDQLARMRRYADTPSCRMLQLVQHFGDENDSTLPCGICDVCASSLSIAQDFRSATPDEVKAANVILAALRERDGRAVGQIHRDFFEAAASGADNVVLDRRSLDHLLGALARTTAIRIAGDSFIKDGETIQFQRVWRSNANVTAAVVTELRIPVVPLPSAKGTARGGAGKKSSSNKWRGHWFRKKKKSGSSATGAKKRTKRTKRA